MSFVAKTVSALYLFVLFATTSLSGWADDPIAFYTAYYGHYFTHKPIPQICLTALEHMSIIQTQLYFQYAVFIVILTWRMGQAKTAMLVGMNFCALTLAADYMAPSPSDQMVSVMGVTLPFTDAVPALFGMLFGLGVVVAENVDDPEKRAAHACKTWSVIFLNIVVFSHAYTIMDPATFYKYDLHKNYENTAETVKMIMERVAWIVAVLQVLAAVIMAGMTHLLQLPKPGMYFWIVYWLIQLLFIQLFFPWQHYAQLVVPMFQDDGTLVVPPFVLCCVTMVGCFGALHNQDAYEEAMEVQRLEDEAKEEAAADDVKKDE